MLFSSDYTVLTITKSGRDLHKSPEFLPLKRGRFLVAFYESDGGLLEREKLEFMQTKRQSLDDPAFAL